MTRYPSLRLPAVLCSLLLLAACNGGTGPTAAVDENVRVDTGAGTMTLKTLHDDLPPHGRVRLELLGADLALDEDGHHVSLSVSVRNAGENEVAGPLVLWLGPFDPPEVHLAEPDTLLPLGAPIDVGGFVYDDEFGDDGVLAPGETSAPRTWRFHTPAQEPFSFAVRAARAVQPHGPVLSGHCFHDGNRNGMLDEGEWPLHPAHVMVSAPGGGTIAVRVAPDGTYAYPLVEAGLHRILFVPDFETFAPVAYSTPNPQHVLITTDADGDPLGYDGAHFGAYTDVPHGPPPLRFTDLPPDSLHAVFWTLSDVELDGRQLVLEAGFSGCDPDHAFTLWMSGGVMESLPPQVNLVPVHETDQACDAAWQREFRFDLSPLAARFLDYYGGGALQLNVIDFEGNRHELLWQFGDDDKPRD